MKNIIISALVCGLALGAAAADVTITKPYFRWLFNGFGFQNSEANFLALMPEDFRDQRGAVVFVGSNSSERVSRKRLVYVTSKGGMDTMRER